MLLKNISQKVIHVGNVMILPEETKPVDDSLSTAPAVAALISRNALVVVGTTAKAPTEEPAKDAAGGTGEGQGEEDKDKKPLSRMNKQELVDECLKLGLDIVEDDTKETLAEKIRVATAG